MVGILVEKDLPFTGSRVEELMVFTENVVTGRVKCIISALFPNDKDHLTHLLDTLRGPPCNTRGFSTSPIPSRRCMLLC